MITTIFQVKSNTYHILEPIIERFFPKTCACTFTSKQFHWFIQLCKETLQHFARFWRLFQSVMKSRSIVVPFYLGVSLSVFLFLNFIAISDCVFFIMKTIILRGLTGYQIIITILALRPSLDIYHLQRALVVYKIAYPRAFMTLRVAQFSLKIAHLSFPMGPPGPRAYAVSVPDYGSWLSIVLSLENGLLCSWLCSSAAMMA